LQVSYELRKLAKSEGPDAEEFKDLAMSVENFAINLIEPLKSDEIKKAIFQGKDFDRIADQAVKYEQKKVCFTIRYCCLLGQEKKTRKKTVFVHVWFNTGALFFPFVTPKYHK
jgi:hypothetical protein